jgi:PelA/Pel-15E family pectate lyase
MPRTLRLLLAASFIFSTPLLAAGGGAAAYLKKPDAWFATPEAKSIAANILSYQSDLGGWPKNTDTVDKPYKGDRKELKPTFDNGATTDELRFLARSFNATRDASHQKAFHNGLAYLLKAQYPNGGWPQYIPLSKQYHRHITFNDGAMVRVMEFLREVHDSPVYTFVPDKDRKAASAAFTKGVDCILKCQILVGGKPTVWCAQHDEVTLKPANARSYELASFSGSESVGITRLLMSLEKPSPEIIKAVEGAIAWFQSSKITGIRIDSKNGDRIVVPDPGAKPLWARFYDLKTGKPYFCDRDGIPKPNLADIGSERRNGYSWYGTYAASLLDMDYPAWKQRVK